MSRECPNPSTGGGRGGYGGSRGGGRGGGSGGSRACFKVISLVASFSFKLSLINAFGFCSATKKATCHAIVLIHLVEAEVEAVGIHLVGDGILPIPHALVLLHLALSLLVPLPPLPTIGELRLMLRSLLLSIVRPPTIGLQSAPSRLQPLNLRHPRERPTGIHLILGQQALARLLLNRHPTVTGEPKLMIGLVLRAAVVVLVHPNQHLMTGVAAAARLRIQANRPTIGVRVLAIHGQQGPTLLLGEEAVVVVAVVEAVSKYVFWLYAFFIFGFTVANLIILIVKSVERKVTCQENVLPPVVVAVEAEEAL